MKESKQKITTFLMFEGKAKQAMDYYLSIFDESEINHILYQEDGSVLHATFTLNGQPFMCIDSSISHGFSFTPAISLFVNCESEKEVEEKFEKLSLNGKVLMPLSPSPVSKLFGWVEDQFGVSWQLNCAK
ncbi:VOC family protein [Bacillus sp. FJAT-49736]|uniref:VOC family protein n=1 Tax=Bacillus sp. FJAT-49736 TaxID=2833582 RepID=UPI001BC9DFE0|nr:VOC family protein [Bacillus sp. FJAT-49736]MBS4174740.1 VOC family protein [Bacillus sp. FJAT-49736]